MHATTRVARISGKPRSRLSIFSRRGSSTKEPLLSIFPPWISSITVSNCSFPGCPALIPRNHFSPVLFFFCPSLLFLSFYPSISFFYFLVLPCYHKRENPAIPPRLLIGESRGKREEDEQRGREWPKCSAKKEFINSIKPCGGFRSRSFPKKPKTPFQNSLTCYRVYARFPHTRNDFPTNLFLSFPSLFFPPVYPTFATCPIHRLLPSPLTTLDTFHQTPS